MTERARAPIFVVGSPRSGTTLLRLILDSHPEIACGPETHFLATMDEAAQRYWTGLERYGFDREYWIAKSRAFFEEFKDDYARSKGKSRWADKTPLYAQHLPFVLALFPEAQVVNVVRDAHQVTASALSRWGWRRAWQIPERWVASVSGARSADLPAAQYRELRFEQLVGETEPTLRALFDWLGERWDPRVLDYDQLEHDGSGRNREVSAEARASGGQAIDASRARRSRRQLDPVLRLRVERVAGRLNRELGYR